MIALVTGASAGFGQAICRRLVTEGHQVIGAARRSEKLTQLQQELGFANFYPLQMDVSDTKNIDQALESLPEAWRTIDILTMIQTNVIGLVYLTRQIIPQMVERDSGLIINLGSTAGTVPYPGANVYGASKAFVKQFSLNLRADLAGHHIRVTNIEPGLCEGTEFSTVRFKGDKQRSEKLYEGAHAIQPVDIANTVAWIVGQPPHVNINRIELMPVSQTFGPQPVFREE